MSRYPCVAAVAALLLGAGSTQAQAERVVLRPEPQGPAGVITSVTFSPDGSRLYSAGYDKVIRSWSLDRGVWKPMRMPFRVPIGPGYSGAINALAVSPDGNSLAAGGVGVMQGRGDFRSVGMIFPSSGKSRSQLEDEGAIFVFNASDDHDVRVLRGHAGPVRSLAFLTSGKGTGLRLVSAAEEFADASRAELRLRLWDVSARTLLAEQSLPLHDSRLPPGIHGWSIGPGPADAAIAIAAHDGKLRLWLPAAQKVVEADDGQFNAALAPAGRANEFWSASFTGGAATLRLWRAGPDRLTNTATISLAAEDPRNGPFLIPRDLAIFPSQPGGAQNRAAILARRQGPRPSDRDDDALVLVDLDARAAIGGPRPLGAFPQSGHWRRLAASPAGRNLAIADADRQQILAFTTDALAANAAGATPQVLRGVGTDFVSVAFARKDNRIGLRLRDADGQRMLFDFSGRAVLSDDGTWQPDAPDGAGWTMTPALANGRLTIAVGGPNFPNRTVTVAERARGWLTGVIHPRPPTKGAGPLLAAAWLDSRGQAMLTIHDLATGATIRQLAGHLGPIRSLGFSTDGRLLASVAEDQTACLWSMVSLDQVVGKVGSLPGVRVRTDGQSVRVVESPADSGLARDAVIESVAIGEQVRPVSNAIEFYTAIWQSRPGDEVALRVRGGAGVETIRRRIEQGTDERKPLLSLFVTRDGPPEQRHWIAWTSIGPYDASSLRAEEHLGWHFNPDKVEAGEPVTFARADKYRDQFQRRGILEHVVRRGNTLEAIKDFEAKPPVMGVRIEGIDPAAPMLGDRRLVRTKRLRLAITLEEPFPIERVTEVRWRWDGEADWRRLETPADRTWSADLSAMDWSSGPHAVRVEMSVDGGSRTLRSIQAVHYLPPPPTIRFAESWLTKHFPKSPDAELHAETSEPSFALEADATAGEGSPGVAVAIRVNGGTEQPAERPVRQNVPLREGPNTIDIIATNRGATDASRPWESTVRSLRVDYYRQAPPPRLSLRVRPESGAEPLTPARDGAIIVRRNRFIVEGVVTTEGASPDVSRNDRIIPVKRGAAAGQFTFTDEIVLPPPAAEAVAYEYVAQVPRGAASREAIRIRFQPELPQVAAIEPRDGAEVFAERATLRVSLAQPDPDFPCTADVTVNGERQARDELPAAAVNYSPSLTLKPGANRVTIRLANAWGAERARTIELRYCRPPVIQSLAAPAVADAPSIPVRAVVASPNELRPTSATINGQLYDRELFAAQRTAENTWDVAISGVILQEGANELTVTIANEDGASRDTRSARVRYDRSLPPKPIVSFPGYLAGESQTVREPRLALPIRIESTTPIQRIRLDRADGTPLLSRSAPLPKTVLESVMLDMTPGRLTTVTLTAVNEGGEARASLSLWLPEQPAFVVIDEFREQRSGRVVGAVRGAGGERKLDEQGRPIFADAREGKLTISGRVVWPGGAPERAAGRVNVRVRANAFQQIPVQVEAVAPGQSQCRFSATVLLTRSQENEIVVDLIDAQKADGIQDRCVIPRCDAPEMGRRLHLLVIGAGVRDGEALRGRVRSAIQARLTGDPRLGGPPRWQAPPIFTDVRDYQPLVGDVDIADFMRLLQFVRLRIEQMHAAGGDDELSDVVLLCFDGEEDFTKDGHVLITSRQFGVRDEFRVPVNGIIREFERTRGAQVLLLDVRRPNAVPQTVVQTFANSRLGVLQAVRSDKDAPAGQLLALLQESWPRANRLITLAEHLESLRPSVAPQVRFFRNIEGQLALLEFGGLAP